MKLMCSVCSNALHKRGVCKKNQMNEVESINSYKPIQKTNKVFFFDKKNQIKLKI